jgi:hypothetical protein
MVHLLQGDSLLPQIHPSLNPISNGICFMAALVSLEVLLLPASSALIAIEKIRGKGSLSPSRGLLFRRNLLKAFIYL